MSPIKNLIEEVSAAADADGKGDDPKAHAALLQAIHELTLAAERPTETAKRIMYQPPTNAALRVAVETGLVEAVVVSGEGGRPISARDLAGETNVDELLVIRVMRALTAMGVCTESGLHLYSANAVTRELATPGLGNGVKCLYDTFMLAAPSIVPGLQAIGYRAPRTIQETPVHYAHNVTLFQWLKENPQERTYFDNYMAGRRKDIVRWYHVYPVKEQLAARLRQEEDAVLLVDVGGSQGHDLAAFKDLFADLPGKLVLEDLPETIHSIPPLNGIETLAYDFYTPQPNKGARLYHFGAICHDWADEYCVQFLSNTAQAMDKHYSTLLINDYVVPEMGASLRAASMDLQMMSLFAGIERTESQWRSLLDASGLDIVKIWYSATGLESIIETKLKS